MSVLKTSSVGPRRRSPWFGVTALNLAALAGLAVPALLILHSSGVAAEIGYNLFTAVIGLLAVGVLACGAAACAMGRRGGSASAALLLPLAAMALVCSLALLAGLMA